MTLRLLLAPSHSKKEPTCFLWRCQRIWRRFQLVGAPVSGFVSTMGSLLGALSYVRSGSHQLSGSTDPGPPRLTPGVRRTLKIMGPGVLGAGVTQINLLVSTALASLLPGGSVSFLYYADRLNQLLSGG